LFKDDDDDEEDGGGDVDDNYVSFVLLKFYLTIIKLQKALGGKHETNIT